MLFGNRAHPSMRRTTSLTEFTLDVEAPMAMDMDTSQPSVDNQMNDWLRHGNLKEVSQSGRRFNRRNSGDFRVVETAAFLKACGLCKRRLGHGKDIFIYRGEIAFCSLECRQQLINQEERKEKLALSSMKARASPATASTTDLTSGSSAETVAAA